MAGRVAPLHYHGWWENQDGGGTEQELAAVTDPSSICQVQATDFIRVPGTFPNILAVAVGLDGTVAPRARLQAPSLDEMYGRDQAFLPAINVAADANVEFGSPQLVNDFRGNPIPLKAGENVRILQVNNPSAARDQWATAIWGRPVSPVDTRGAFCVRATTTAAALTAGAWGNRAITLDTPLRTGWYELLGAKVLGATLIAAGARFEAGPNRVPVGVADAEGDILHPIFAPGQLGSLGTFHTQNPFSVDLLANDADNESQVIYAWVRPVGG